MSSPCYKFTCGHEYKRKTGRAGPTKDFPELCPDCKLNQPTPCPCSPLTPSISSEEKALDIWRSQVDHFDDLMENADPTSELYDSLKTMRDNCQVLWAEKVKNIELLKAQEIVDGYGDLAGWKLEKRYEMALVKIGVVLKAERILLGKAEREGNEGDQVERTQRVVCLEVCEAGMKSSWECHREAIEGAVMVEKDWRWKWQSFINVLCVESAGSDPMIA